MRRMQRRTGQAVPRTGGAVRNRKKIPEATISRLSVCARALRQLHNDGVEVISSDELGAKTGSSGAQIRKDLSFFGEFGKTGRGYYVKDLEECISRILGIDKKWNVALVGAGQLGSALLAYPGFRERGFDIAAVFDNDLRKIGKTWERVVVQDMSELRATIRARDIRVAIMAVPAPVSQETADLLVSSGVRAILNFAPAKISVPEGVELRNADLSTELECLSYFLSNEARVRTRAVSPNGGEDG